MNILIKSARIIDSNSRYHNQIMDMLIKNGKIDKISKSIKKSKESKTEIEFSAKNLHVSTGWMDLHTNFREPGFEQKDDLETGINSAIQGGFTSVLLMPETLPVIDNKSNIEFIKNKTSNSIIDVHTSGAVTKNMKGKELVEMHDMNSTGCRIFTDDKRSIQNNKLLEIALLYSKDINGLIMNYPNDHSISKDGVINEGWISTKIGMKGMPNIAEEIMLSRDIKMSEYTNSPIHTSYVSTKDSVRMINEAKRKGIKITSDVSINNIILCEDSTQSFDTRYKVLPPLRTQKDIKSLIKGLKNGTIDVISTDHSPEDEENKKMEFDNAKFGILGLETAFGLICKNLLGDLSITDIIEKISTNPRRIALKEEIKIDLGEKANITLFDPEKKWNVKEKDIKSKSLNTPFIQEDLQGKALAIYNNKKFKIID